MMLGDALRQAGGLVFEKMRGSVASWSSVGTETEACMTKAEEPLHHSRVRCECGAKGGTRQVMD